MFLSLSLYSLDGGLKMLIVCSQFFQVGREPGAAEYLKQLDNGLAEIAGDSELRDIVDTVPFKGNGDEELSAVGIMKVSF